MSSPHMTILTGLTPIAKGTNREVWDRPNHPDQILKTVLAHKREKYEKRSAARRLFEDMRHGPYGAFRAEYRCYLRTAYQCLQTGRPIPIAEIGGLEITDHGLAQVGEKITDAAGGLAKHLLSFINNKTLDQELVQLLNEFIATIYALNVNVPDLTAVNILLDERRGRFVMVDGYGDRTLIPARAMIKALNQQQMDMRFPAMAVPDYLDWDAQRKAFSLV